MPPFVGKPPTPLAAPKLSPHATPGLGDRMRQETGSALETAFKKSAFQTGREDLVKTAAFFSKASAPSLPPLSHPMMGAARALPGRVMGPMKRGLGLGALGAAGALAYGMHQQNDQDRDANSLVYAPMQGSVMG